MKTLLSYSLCLLVALSAFSQKNPTYWQQHGDYTMDVKMDVKTYRYKGAQQLIYTNNSPDTIRKVFYHLYPNAFQPGSEMDARVQSIVDPDGRMAIATTENGKKKYESRIKNLKPDEIGFLNISNFKQDGVTAEFISEGTIMEVRLAKPLLPGKSTTFNLDFEGQVPVQIRRSGRNNKEGVELSMSQWYPKLAEYDFEGWHADPYIAREFHGVWSDFDVKITIDKNYMIGGTGYLQNPDEIGYGYENPGTKITRKSSGKTLTWHFKAPMVHDFAWAADKNFLHDTAQVPGGATLHFFYKNNPKILENWKKVQPYVVKLMQFNNSYVGNYPYKQYSIIQGGDGGMEYAMCTFILGEGTFDGLLGVIAHEMAHSWFQHVLASNESEHGWMDEGFTSFLEETGLNQLADPKQVNPYSGAYEGYISLANSGKEQPLSTHADRFDINRVYSIASYSKGELFLSQLIYLIGQQNLDKTLHSYWNNFKFTHPTPNDIKRCAEKVSGAELQWYLTDWTETTNTIDYAVKSAGETTGKTRVTLERIGRTPMPIDLLVEYTDGSRETFYVPLREMHFIKDNPDPSLKRTVLPNWAWAYPTYEFNIEKPKSQIRKITIDPAGLMADVKRENNVLQF